MRIIEQMSNKIPFEKVLQGEAFKCGDYVYMKIESIVTFNEEFYNAVDFIGELSFFQDDDIVNTYPDSEIVLK